MSQKQNRSGPGSWLFLAVVLLLYLLAGVLNPEATHQALGLFSKVLHQVIPALGLVFILLFVANLVLTPKSIQRYLGERAGLKGWLVSIGGGILSMGPVYAWYTMLGELQQKGMRTALIATFLYSRAIKLPLLPLMIYYFGVTYTLVLCLHLAIFSIINGLLVEKLANNADSDPGI